MDEATLNQAMGLERADSRLVIVQGPRGAGKSWSCLRAADNAMRSGMRVHRLSGRVATTDHVQAVIGDLDSPSRSGPSRSCVVVDDFDEVDAATRWDLRAAIEATGSTGFFSMTKTDVVEGASMLRLDPLPSASLTQVLVDRGIAPIAASRCATAAAGNPGLAIALAEGLTAAQRADRAPVPDLPRLAPDIGAVMQARVRELGERAVRALVVAAADEAGDLATVSRALTFLGETPEGAFDDAEEAGIVEITGNKIVFRDPWTRLATYRLLAPASRRAAHRALAECCTAPRQAEQRVRHLAAASDGPSDQVAESLLLVATATARRRGPIAAADLAARGAEFALSPDLRRSCLLCGIGWYLDGGGYTRAAEVAEEMDGESDDERWAAAEVQAVLRGGEELTSPPDTVDPSPGVWKSRHLRRRAWWHRALGGDHQGLVRSIELESSAPAEGWAAVIANRHSGRLREATDLLDRLLEQVRDQPSHMRVKLELAQADLVALSGRTDDAHVLLEGRSFPRLEDEAAAIRSRCLTSSNPADLWHQASITFEVPEPLRTLRIRLLGALSSSDAAAAAAVAADAAEAHLPIEAAEARLIAAEIAVRQNSIVQARDWVDEAASMLHRCGVRLWDLRIRAVGDACSASVAKAKQVAPPDPAVDALSTAERRVADAVASGATNREVAATLFLSVKTVDFHLQQIYRKLEIRSRTELAVRLSGRAGISEPRTGPGANR
jgi:DNA-binding NarL/FixJ family response regulator